MIELMKYYMVSEVGYIYQRKASRKLVQTQDCFFNSKSRYPPKYISLFLKWHPKRHRDYQPCQDRDGLKECMTRYPGKCNSGRGYVKCIEDVDLSSFESDFYYKRFLIAEWMRCTKVPDPSTCVRNDLYYCQRSVLTTECLRKLDYGINDVLAAKKEKYLESYGLHYKECKEKDGLTECLDRWNGGCEQYTQLRDCLFDIDTQGYGDTYPSDILRVLVGQYKKCMQKPFTDDEQRLHACVQHAPTEDYSTHCNLVAFVDCLEENVFPTNSPQQRWKARYLAEHKQWYGLCKNLNPLRDCRSKWKNNDQIVCANYKQLKDCLHAIDRSLYPQSHSENIDLDLKENEDKCKP